MTSKEINHHPCLSCIVNKMNTDTAPRGDQAKIMSW